jgi:adenylate kinase
MSSDIKTIIFVGRSGSGKGTQIDLLKQFITEKKGLLIKSIVMGDIFRGFFSENGYVQEVAKDLSIRQGKFQPDFLTDALFVSNVIKSADKESIMFFDGYPRNIHQLELIKELLKYLGRETPIFINLEVARQSVKNRMLLRGRRDDHSEAIENRLDEYDKFVFPMIEKAKDDNYFKYIGIDGEGTVEDIHKNILVALGYK